MAFIARLLDPLLESEHMETDTFFEKEFDKLQPHRDEGVRDCLARSNRINTYAMDWAGDKLLVATKETSIQLFDMHKSIEERSWSGEWMAMQCDPNNTHIAAAVSWGGKFRVFDTRASEKFVWDVELKKSSPQMKEFLQLSWSPNSKFIALNNRADQVYIIDMRQGLRLGASRSLGDEVNQMVWGADSDTLWVATGGSPGAGKLHVFPAPSLSLESSAVVVAHQYATIALAADQQGNHIASGGGDCLTTLWDPRHLVCTRTFGYATQPITTLGFSKSGDLLAWGTGASGSTGGEKNLTIVGANTGALYWHDATPAPVQHLKWHPTRNVLAYSLNTAQLPDERATRSRVRDKDPLYAAVHFLKLPDSW